MRLGTRGSPLALAQARWVAGLIGGDVSLVTVTTTGDRDRARLDKAKWVRELEAALLDGRIDLAVHSAKDVPTLMPPGLILAGAPAREDPRDALVGSLGPVVGTASLRRAAQLRAASPELSVVDLRGNVDTRLSKLAAGEVDGLVLALAGLRRLDRAEGASPLELVPAAGQGTIALQARAGDERAVEVARSITDDDAWEALVIERACVRGLGADCQSALGAHYDGAALRCWAGRPDGSEWVADRLAGSGEALGSEVAERMLAAGAGTLL